MRTLVVGAIVCWLAGAATLRAQSLPSALEGFGQAPGEKTVSSVSDPAIFSSAETNVSQSRFWVEGDYLLWWLSGNHLPPLVTTSPAGTPVAAAGVLGAPGTEVLFGNTNVNDGARSGGRLTTGYWFDPEQTCGIEASFFMLQSLTQGFAAGSTGQAILARPFFNTATGLQDAELVTFPGIIKGTVAATASSGPLLGAEALFRRNLCSCCWGGNGFRLDGLAGFRFLYLQEDLAIQENLTSTDPASKVPPGTLINLNDRFDTRNDFYGGEVGLAAEFFSGRWSLNLVSKLAVGATQSVVNIAGSTVVTEPGTAPFGQPGGLLAQFSNSGPHEGTRFSLVPELDINLGYQLTANCRITAGYSLLYWTGVARPGDQIDLAVNPNQLPPIVPGGDLHPVFPFHRSSLGAQGLSVGIAFRF